MANPTYTGPGISGVTLDVQLLKSAPTQDSFPTNSGIVLRRGRTRGHVLPWSEAVLHLGWLLPRSAEARQDVAKLLAPAPSTSWRLELRRIAAELERLSRQAEAARKQMTRSTGAPPYAQNEAYELSIAISNVGFKLNALASEED